MREAKGEKRRGEAREDQACITARYIGEREREREHDSERGRGESKREKDSERRDRARRERTGRSVGSGARR